MSIYFARHGQTDWNVAMRVQGTTDIPLNRHGRNQAEVLADRLQTEGILLQHIYSSPLSRALETAQIVSRRFDIVAEPMQGLQEMNLGVFEGHTWDEIHVLYPKEHACWRLDKRFGRPPQGESYQEVLERFFVMYDHILTETEEELQAGGDILIVTHGVVVMLLLALLRDVDLEKAYLMVEVPNATPIRLEMEEMEQIRRKL